MKSSKYKLKIAALVVLSLFMQVVIISSILGSGDKRGKSLDEKMRRSSIEYEYGEEDELDVIERSKKGDYERMLGDEPTDDGVEEKTESQIVINDSTGKVAVDLTFNPEGTSKSQNGKTQKDKSKSPSNTPSNKKPTTYSIEKIKEIAVGTWKGVNDSNGKYNDIYIEFFEDGSYQKYSEGKENTHKGKYTFTSPNKIKIIYENAESDDTGWSVKENETFTADINFKDENSFSVTDTNRFSFKNYKKVN